jgi:hypothetical protein
MSSHSGFLITINTNKSISDQNSIDDLVQGLDRVSKYIASHEGLQRILIFLIPGDTYGRPPIYDVKADYAIEKGNNKHRIHCHIYLRIEHTSMIRLDRAEIVSIVDEIMGIRNAYVNIKIIGNDQNLKEYLKKQALREGTSSIIITE